VTEVQTVEVRALRPDEIPAAVGVLARGMRDNPLHVAAYGSDPERRERVHAKLMAAFFRVFTTQQPICAVEGDTVVGVVGVAPVGSCHPRALQRLRFLPTILGLGPRTAARVGKWLDTWGAHDPSEDHVHLGPVAVDRHLQGRGIGSQLMRTHCAALDAAGDVGYLETDKPENVRFYERFDYRVIRSEPVLGVPNWYMRRVPTTSPPS
jgi:ribosomal protein S18 acetylase RimI-like enzyme